MTLTVSTMSSWEICLGKWESMSYFSYANFILYTDQEATIQMVKQMGCRSAKERDKAVHSLLNYLMYM